MKNHWMAGAAFGLVLAGPAVQDPAGSLAMAQDANTDRVTVPLADPNRPARLNVSLLSGSIAVKTHAARDVVVEIRQEVEEPREKTRGGLRRIPNTSTGLTVEQDDNTIEVGTGRSALHKKKQLTVFVPQNTSVKLSTVNDGDIEVEGINGEIEVNNVNGSVTLKDVSGWAVAHALNGDLVVTFRQVTPDKSMSFSSLNGRIDVTLPPQTKATLNLKSDQGEIFTDFDIAMENTATRIEEEGKVGKKRIVLEKGMRGTINGGGAEFLFKNFNGDIFIRKGK